MKRNAITFFLTVILLGLCSHAAIAADPLPSWHESAAKQAIITFVKAVTDESSADFVPVDGRIATFDNDGTLWSEKPIYFQLQFAIDKVKELAPQHPEWKEQQPFKAVLEDDIKDLIASGKHGLLKLIMATHSGMTTDEFVKEVHNWLQVAKHPRFNRPYDELVYQPMLELLRYLRANGFKTFIVSGGGIEFMRAFAEKVYGVPPEQVVGSSIKTKFEIRSGKPVLVRLPGIDFIDDKDGKPVGINQFIGRRPIAAFGNSDGDLQMLQWTAADKTKSFCLLVHHTDAKREWAYDRDSAVGRLDKALDIAHERKWTVVDIKNDWKIIYPKPGPDPEKSN